MQPRLHRDLASKKGVRLVICFIPHTKALGEMNSQEYMGCVYECPCMYVVANLTVFNDTTIFFEKLS